MRRVLEVRRRMSDIAPAIFAPATIAQLKATIAPRQKFRRQLLRAAISAPPTITPATIHPVIIALFWDNCSGDKCSVIMAPTINATRTMHYDIFFFF